MGQSPSTHSLNSASSSSFQSFQQKKSLLQTSTLHQVYSTVTFNPKLVARFIRNGQLCPFLKSVGGVESQNDKVEGIEGIEGLEGIEGMKGMEGLGHNGNQPNGSANDIPATQDTLPSGQSITECPICFLSYPQINATTCCNQPICTECFCQMERINFNAVCCPYCCVEEFGVSFNRSLVTPDMIRPDWRLRQQEYLKEQERQRRAANHQLLMQQQAVYQSNQLRQLSQLSQLSQMNQMNQMNQMSHLNHLNIEDVMVMEAIRQSLQDVE